MRSKVCSIFQDVKQKLDYLNKIYADIVKTHSQKEYTFGLDSFYFQGKLIDIEYEDMNRLFLAITNRMYCEYFKLYKIIIEYISNNITDPKLLDLIKVSNNYPVYKDLEPFKLYNFEIIQNIHEIIITLLHSINGCIINKERDLDAHKAKNNTGLNIDNFVNTFNFNIVIMREKLVLFVTYIEFFHKLHNKYLKRFTTKLQLMFSQINNDIKFDDTDQTKKTKRASLLHNIADDNVDNALLAELHNSMTSLPSPVNNSFVHELFPEIAGLDDPDHITLNIDNRSENKNEISDVLLEDTVEIKGGAEDIKENEEHKEKEEYKENEEKEKDEDIKENEEKEEHKENIEVKKNEILEVQTIKIKRAYKPKKPKN